MTKTQAKKVIVALENSIIAIETEQLTQEEFEEFCDCAYTLMCYLRIIPNRKGGK